VPLMRSKIYPGHSNPLSLAIPPWVSAMSTGDGFGHLWEETVHESCALFASVHTECHSDVIGHVTESARIFVFARLKNVSLPLYIYTYKGNFKR